MFLKSKKKRTSRDAYVRTERFKKMDILSGQKIESVKTFPDRMSRIQNNRNKIKNERNEYEIKKDFCASKKIKKKLKKENLLEM